MPKSHAHRGSNRLGGMYAGGSKKEEDPRLGENEKKKEKPNSNKAFILTLLV